MQGNSLSPLLFVLCIDPLSRKLNCTFPKEQIKTDEENYVTNYLLLINDLKLNSEKKEILLQMCIETEKIF